MLASLLVGLLAAGLAGGAVLAQRRRRQSGRMLSITPDSDSSQGSDYAARVASILGIDAEQVEAAHKAGCAGDERQERLDAQSWIAWWRRACTHAGGGGRNADVADLTA